MEEKHEIHRVGVGVLGEKRIRTGVEKENQVWCSSGSERQKEEQSKNERGEERRQMGGWEYAGKGRWN